MVNCDLEVNPLSFLGSWEGDSFCKVLALKRPECDPQNLLFNNPDMEAHSYNTGVGKQKVRSLGLTGQFILISKLQVSFSNPLGNPHGKNKPNQKAIEGAVAMA